jgi:hypothetical protein
VTRTALFGASTIARRSGAELRLIRVCEPEATKSGCDLIVMSTHARHSVWRLFLGSLADHCVHHSPVPVLLIRSYGDSGAFGTSRVVIALGEAAASEA